MSVTSIRSFLSPTHLEAAGGFVLMTAGSALSPAWPVLNAILDPLVRIMTGSGNVLGGYLKLIGYFEAMSPQEIFFTVQLPLLLLTVFQLGFVILCYRLGVYVARYVIKHRPLKAS